ncbi:MarR family winged helix-turn-helix transcriptional regulator [Breznakiella homolactica]|uniref:MarR family transcriptional regulator n=1 Tax=Breznakiella homolactica TaxID=2798577 RepID=A0A7T7XM04_9SPIR|nr:MarR family transcriptional regulator [Breznakiella homolactica]QQO08771.1 MarR family transcriptional regulator [Breznakiella homolactica]
MMIDNYTELNEKLSRLQWLLQRQHFQSHAERGPMADPTRGQGRVLAILKLQPEISTKDLSYLLGIRQQSLNELLNKLEKSGFVERIPSEADRRIMMVRLTEKGKAEPQSEGDFSGIFSCLNPEERTAFGDYLDRIIAALEAQLGIEADEESFDWMNGARSRMGAEMFERLMEMRGGPRPHRHGHPGGPFRGGFEGCGGRHGRGPAPENMPGAERFSPDYTGPVPDRDGTGPSGVSSEKNEKGE